MAFGGFGAAKPAFPFGGGAPATTGAPAFGAFGTTATTTATGFGAFGANTSTGSAFGALGGTPASTAPSLFGGGGFGTTPAKPATGFGTSTFGSTGFGSTTQGFGAGTSAFGTSAPAFGTSTSGTGLFGATSAFGGGTTLGGTSAFGAGGGFGAGFGAKPATTGFGGFGTGLGTAPAFGQQPQQQQQQAAAAAGPTSAHEALVAAVFNCQVFGDERDQVLAKWNLLQAQWGKGKAYYSRTAPPLELTEQNPLCRFKAVGYSRLGGREDKDGHVSLLFHKPEQEIKNNQQQLIASLSGLLGNKPNLTVHVDCVKAVSDNKTQVVVYVAEAGGGRVSASELAAYMNSASPRATLTSAGCGPVAAVARPSAQALHLYLKDSPPGMDIRLWKQAQADNPDPDNYIPVPIVGFSEIKWRTRCQAEETALHAGFLRRAGEELAELRTRRAAAAARLHHLAADLYRLRHTLLQVVCRQEMVSRLGSALAPEEEAACARLHELASQLAAPPLYNGRLNELLSAVRLQRSASAAAAGERYHLDPGAQEDMMQFLVLQQKSMAHLMQTAREDLAALHTVAEGMALVAQGV